MQINPLHRKMYKWLPGNYLDKPSTVSSYTSDIHMHKAKHFRFTPGAFPLTYCEYLLRKNYLMRPFSLTSTAWDFVLSQWNFGCILTNLSGFMAALSLVNGCLKCSISRLKGQAPKFHFRLKFSMLVSALGWFQVSAKLKQLHFYSTKFGWNALSSSFKKNLTYSYFVEKLCAFILYERSEWNWK